MSCYDQIKEIPKLKKENPELREVYAQTLQDVTRRLDKSFQSFFRRVKENKQGKKQKPGYPRFKGYWRYDSFVYPQSGFELKDNKLNLSKVVKKGHMHKVFNIFKAMGNSNEPQIEHLEIVTCEGETRVVDVTWAPLRENGKFTGTELSMQDVTDKTVIDKLKKNYMKTLEGEVVSRTKEIKDTQRAAILAIANLAESIDDDTGGHIQRMRHYSRVIAEELKNHPKYKHEITDEYVEMIFDLSPLHDLGKVGIRDYILQKTDKLTKEEFEKMKEHTVIGARALRMAGEMIHRDSVFAIAEMIARFHHEKWDGTGYPAVDINGEFRPLKGEEIPLCARIVALADVYDALTSKRPYKMPFPHEVAKDMMLKQSGKHFDPAVVDAFKVREQEFIRIREQFPETLLPEGRPFQLPARDIAEAEELERQRKAGEAETAEKSA